MELARTKSSPYVPRANEINPDSPDRIDRDGLDEIVYGNASKMKSIVTLALRSN